MHMEKYKRNKSAAYRGNLVRGNRSWDLNPIVYPQYSGFGLSEGRREERKTTEERGRQDKQRGENCNPLCKLRIFFNMKIFDTSF